MIRLCIGPSPRAIVLPADYQLAPGRGIALTDGDDALLFAYGPVMLHEALLAAELLADRDFGLSVVNLPWLNRFDGVWLRRLTRPFAHLFVLEDHAPIGGLADALLRTLIMGGDLGERRFDTFAVDGYPACGTPQEALQYHRLDGASLASRVLARVRG
jgi:transketolase